jgi:hypothetical protein
MLYSEATGQKMPMSATTPYAGSLVEQGGKLYQQATFQDGARTLRLFPRWSGFWAARIRRPAARTRLAARASAWR